MLICALVIVAGLLTKSSLSPAFGLVASAAGVATVLVGIVMLFGIAHDRE
jgi:hypothetical protein